MNKKLDELCENFEYDLKSGTIKYATQEDIASERYNTRVEIPISIILETIFNDDNHDVETLSRWAKHYGFVDLIEKDSHKYYKLQDDYTKQSFYIWLSKEERKQYEYEDYLLDKISDLESKGE